MPSPRSPRSSSERISLSVGKLWITFLRCSSLGAGRDSGFCKTNKKKPAIRSDADAIFMYISGAYFTARDHAYGCNPPEVCPALPYAQDYDSEKFRAASKIGFFPAPRDAVHRF